MHGPADPDELTTIAGDALPEAGASDQRYALDPEAPSSAARSIGQGAFGRVLLVHDEVLDRDVALKELRPAPLARSAEAAPAAETAAWDQDPALEPAVLQRFVREARLTARLEHPSIVPVHDLGQRADGTPYYTMKPIRGRTLAEAIAAAQLPERLDLIDAVVDLCQAVAYAHTRGVLHRDLKPQNVMVGAFGETVVLDWGLAKDRLATEQPHDSYGEGSGLGPGATVQGHVVGTPAYMSPEQARGDLEDVDERSDVWGLGAVLFEVLTGRPPYVGDTARKVLAQVTSGPPGSPREIAPGVPVELASIALKAMAGSPTERYAEALSLAADLQAWRAGRVVSAHSYSPAEQLQRQLARHGGRILAAALASVVLLGMTALSSQRVAQERDRALAAEQESRARLVASLVAQATEAAQNDDATAAKVFATEALLLTEDPRARGALVAADSGMLRELRWRTPLTAAPEHIAWHPTAGLVVVSGDRVDRWTAAGEALPSITGVQANTYGSVDLAPSSGRIALGGHRRLQLLDPSVRTDGPVLEVPLEVSPLSLQWLGEDRVVAAGNTNKQLIFDTRDGQLLATFTGQPGPFRALAATPDGQEVYSASNLGSIVRWRTDDLTLGPPLQQAQLGAFDLDLSKDGRWLLAGGEVNGGDGRFRIWDLRTGALREAVLAHRAEIIRVGWSPDGRWLATLAGDALLRLWSTQTLSDVASLDPAGEGQQRFAFSPDGRSLAVASERARQLAVWSLEPPRGGLSPRSFQRAPQSVAWSPDGTRLAVANMDGTLRIIDMATGEELVMTRPAGGQRLNAVRWHGDDLFVTDDNVAYHLDPATGEERWRLGDTPSELEWASIAVDPQTGTHAWVRHLSQSLRVVAPEDTTPLDITCPDELVTLAWMPRVGELWASGKSGGLYRVDTMQGSCVSLHDDLHVSGRIRLSPDGRVVAVGHGDGVHLLSWPDARLLPGLTGARNSSASISFTPDGSKLLAASWSGEVKVWRLSDQTLLAVWQAHRGRIWGADLSPDGTRLATVAADRSLRVWDLDALDEGPKAAHARVRRQTGLGLEGGGLTTVALGP